MNYFFDKGSVKYDSEGNRFVLTKSGNHAETLFHNFDIELWNSPEVFEKQGIVGYEPMTAKELVTEEEQDKVFCSSDYFIEEKFDGTRALMYFLKRPDGSGLVRVFSRRISKKTGFYVENTDSLPQFYLENVPDLDGTILDGEMFINGRPFKDVSSTLNCKWDKAIDRQNEIGFISFHAFDILFYKGEDLRDTPLYERKWKLTEAILEADNTYIEEVPYACCGEDFDIDDTKFGKMPMILENVRADIERYSSYTHLTAFICGEEKFTPRVYYELVVACGGEGVMIKPSNGLYKHKRGWEYSKIKKFLTREMILIRFNEPTREYTGKAPSTWEYWDKDVPVTRHWFNKQVGNLILGVYISKVAYEKIPKNKRGEVYDPYDILKDEEPYDRGKWCDDYYIMEVCECGGFDDETREYWTKHREEMTGKVIEVKANEIMKDSGRLRHPRFLREREDKNPLLCNWEDHIS